ncbi:MAG: hypothetical protein AABY11_03155, partial [archaeon]
MVMGDVIKDIYFALEDKWYAALDFIDQHGVPIYKAIDPIDQKIPSFAVFAGIIALGLVSFISLGIFSGGETQVIFQIVDEESSPLPNIPVAFTFNGETQTLTSGSDGRITLFAPAGTRVNYEVDLEKYELVKKSLTVNANEIEIIQLSELQTNTLSKTLKLINAVGQPVLANAELFFTCASSFGTAPQPLSGTGGTFVVTPNQDCIPLSVTVQAQGYADVQSYPLTLEKDIYSIILTPQSQNDAGIVITVIDQTNTSVKGIEVSLQNQGIIVENTLTDSLGTATFAVGAGEYTLVVSDPFTNVYSTVQQSIFAISGDTVTQTITVTKNAASLVEVRVIDSKTNTPLKDAIVKLKQGKTILQTAYTNAEGKASVGIPDKTQSYQLSASRDGYVPQQQSISGNQTSVAYALVKADGTNTAKLKVTITDQDAEPVRDAKVVLYNADTGFLSPYEAVLSDVNGVASFTGVTSGNYQAFSYKTSLTGFSEEQFFDIADPETYDFSLIMEIPDGQVSTQVLDQDGVPVPFAKVSVYDAFQNELLGADL